MVLKAGFKNRSFTNPILLGYTGSKKARWNTGKTEERGGLTMANQTTPRTSKEWVDQMLREHYQEAREAKKAGRLVGWSTSLAPRHWRPAGYRHLHSAHRGQWLFLRPLFLCSSEPGLCRDSAQRSGEHAPAGFPALHQQHLPHGNQVV